MELSERERAQQAHHLWCLAAQRAAGDISHDEYAERFRSLLGSFGERGQVRDWNEAAYTF